MSACKSCSCKELQSTKICNHITGYRTDGVNIEVFHGEEIAPHRGQLVTIEFVYCPLCGVQLKDAWRDPFPQEQLKDAIAKEVPQKQKEIELTTPICKDNGGSL